MGKTKSIFEFQESHEDCKAKMHANCMQTKQKHLQKNSVSA